MQKRLVGAPEQRSVTEESWLDLEAMAQVELTSEDPAQPIEGFEVGLATRTPREIGADAAREQPSEAEGRQSAPADVHDLVPDP